MTTSKQLLTQNSVTPILLSNITNKTVLPLELDGSKGTNRALGNYSQIAAHTDVEAIHAWLARYIDTPTTFQNYRKEAERFLLWTIVELHKPFSSLTQEDLLSYQNFLADPQPAERWIAPAGYRISRQSPCWRPFSGPLSPASQRQALAVLNALFSWLVSAGYLIGNPLSLLRQRTPRTSACITRYLSIELWDIVKITIESFPKDTPRNQARYHRVRWLFSLLYLCGLRISEVVNNTMGKFFVRADGSGQERWWLEITGKGNKNRLVPVTDELLTELICYRNSKNLPSLPRPGESTPLLLPIGGQEHPLTRVAAHMIIKTVFKAAATQLLTIYPERIEQAKWLEQASAHWLRHTAGSHMANAALDLRYVRDNLGHTTLATTSQYLHTEDEIRHRETEQRHRLGWGDSGGD